MCKFPEGFTISQTCAISYQIGEDLNQLGDGSKAAKACASALLQDGGDFFTEVFANKPGERLNKWLDHFTAKLGGQDFFNGATPGAVDFALFPFLIVLDAKLGIGKCEGTVVTPALQAWRERLGTNPL